MLTTPALRAMFLAARLIGALALSSGWTYVVAAQPGRVLWETMKATPVGGGDTANAVAYANNRVFVTGIVQGTAPGIVVVNAYAAATGELLWSDQPGGGREDEPKDIATFAGLVFFCGILDDIKFGVIAYDPATGAQVWSDRSLTGGAYACAGDNGKLFVAGVGYTGTNADFFVRAYDAATGVALWDDRFDGGAGADVANTLAVRDGRLYVTGWYQPSPENQDLVLRRYDPATGALVWQRTYAGPAGGQDEGRTIVIAPDRVVVGGFASLTGTATGSTVQAFRADTGRRLWSHFNAGEELTALAIGGGRLLAGSGPQGEPHTNARLRAYDLGTGQFVWGQATGPIGSGINALAADDQYAYFAAGILGANNSTTILVRSVNLATGATVWANARADAAARDLALENNRLFLAGATRFSFSGIQQYLVRGYRAR